MPNIVEITDIIKSNIQDSVATQKNLFGDSLLDSYFNENIKNFFLAIKNRKEKPLLLNITLEELNFLDKEGLLVDFIETVQASIVKVNIVATHLNFESERIAEALACVKKLIDVVKPVASFVSIQFFSTKMFNLDDRDFLQALAEGNRYFFTGEISAPNRLLSDTEQPSSEPFFLERQKAQRDYQSSIRQQLSDKGVQWNETLQSMTIGKLNKFFRIYSLLECLCSRKRSKPASTIISYLQERLSHAESAEEKYEFHLGNYVHQIIDTQLNITRLQFDVLLGDLRQVKYILSNDKMKKSAKEKLLEPIDRDVSIIAYAAWFGSCEGVKFCIDELKISFKWQDSYERGILYYAFRSDSIDVIDYCIKELKIRDNNNISKEEVNELLRGAACYGSIEGMRLCIKEFEIKEYDKDLLFSAAAFSCSVDKIQFCIDTLKIPANSVDREGANLLHCCAQAGSIATIQYCLEELKIPADSIDSEKNDVLRHAAYSGDANVVIFLRVWGHKNGITFNDSANSPMVESRLRRNKRDFKPIKEALSMSIEQLLEDRSSSDSSLAANRV